MSSKKHKGVSDLFRAACELEPDARAAFLEEACAGDTKLRAEVEALLAQDQDHPSFLEDPASLEEPSKPDHKTRTGKSPAAAAAGRTAHPEQIGPYRILEKVGEGGMGAVYVAEQRQPVRRKVALKVIKLGMDTKQVLARFEIEHHALTIMNHPNIARVYDAGATPEGRPYFVMEHVPGIPINDYCDRHLLNTRQRLELFIPVCHAVQHAHQKSVIHRDLKPSNVLVMMQDGKPVPKIIDFGVAKATGQRLTERTLHTEIGQVIGTPEYMSPEQAEMTAIDIDTRTDIYSLGVILYELLVGAMPFDPKSLREAGYAEIQRIIREVDPPRPSTRLSSLGDESTTVAQKRHTDRTSLERQLRGDLDWITMRAMDKDRTRRYETADGLAADLGRHLTHEPVLAGPPSVTYRARKFIRRNRGLVTAAMVVFLVLLAGIVSSTIFAVGQSRARQEAEQARNAAEEQRKLAKQRADELQTVTEFQQSMLGEIDAEKMGNGIFDDLRQRIRESLGAKNTAPEDIDEALASFDTSVMDVNTTNLALKIIDENVLFRAVKTIEKQFADQSLVRAALQQTVADTYLEIGLHKPAMPLQEAVLQTRRQELGDDNPDTLISINNMGFLLLSMGKHDEALPYYREALETRRRVLGDDHPATLTSINNMGGLLQKMGKLGQAEGYYREALEGRRRMLGDDHPETLTSINNMGGLLQSMGKYEDSLPYFREAMEGCRRVLGDDHPDTLTSIDNMALLLKAMGKLQEAEPYFREALDGHRRVLGDDHPDTFRSIGNMGFLLKAMGKNEEALPYYRESLEGKRRVLGDDHPDTLTSINNMGPLLFSMGKHEEALPYFREALESRRRVLGDDHPDTLTSINNMGFLLKSMGKYDEALPYFREAMEGYRRVLGDDHPGTLISIANMGGLLRNLGRLKEAEALGAEAVRGAKAKLDPLHDFRLSALAQHGRTLAAMQRFVEAESELLEAYEGFVETRGHDYKRTKGTLRALVDLYDAWHEAEPDQGYDAKAAQWRAKLPAGERASSLVRSGVRLLEENKFAEAEPLLRECLEIRQKALPEGHWLIFNTMSILGESLAGQGADRSQAVAARIEKLREAEPLLLDGHKGLTTAAETIPEKFRDQRLRQAIQRIINLYESWHAAEPDAGYGAKAAEWRAKLHAAGTDQPEPTTHPSEE